MASPADGAYGATSEACEEGVTHQTGALSHAISTEAVSQDRTMGRWAKLGLVAVGLVGTVAVGGAAKHTVMSNRASGETPTATDL